MLLLYYHSLMFKYHTMFKCLMFTCLKITLMYHIIVKPYGYNIERARIVKEIKHF